MSAFQLNEVVDVTIKGARVTNTYPTRRGYSDGNYVDTGTVLVVRLDEAPTDDRSIAVNLAAPGVTVERVAPAEWPPQPGDLWRDTNPSVWFALFDNYGRKLVMLPADPTKGLTAYEPDQVLAKGPLTLVHREGATS